MDNKIILDDTTYLLDKVIWEKYDMTLTKSNVEEFLLEYKEAHTIAILSVSLETQNMSYSFDPNKVLSKAKINNNGFADKCNKKLDAERLVKQVYPIITTVQKTFTEREKIYYEYCLAENYSEESILDKVDIASRKGLKPIRNSCILKIAIAFNLEVLKK